MNEPANPTADATLALLTEIRDELRIIRVELQISNVAVPESALGRLRRQLFSPLLSRVDKVLEIGEKSVRQPVGDRVPDPEIAQVEAATGQSAITWEDSGVWKRE